MKTKVLFALMVVMLPLSSMRMYAEPLVVPLEENILDPTLGQGGPQRGPETIPVVSIDGYTFTFLTPCNGYVLRLLDEIGIEVYSTVITSSTLLLPPYLSGEYELQLIPEGCNYYFTGTISL